MQDFDFCPNLIKVYLICLNFTKICPNFTRIYQNLIQICPNWPKFCPNLPNPHLATAKIMRFCGAEIMRLCGDAPPDLYNKRSINKSRKIIRFLAKKKFNQKQLNCVSTL